MNHKKPKVLLAHPGTQYSFRLAEQLERLGLLMEFWTGFAIADGSRMHKLSKMLPATAQKKLANRIVSNVPAHKIKPAPLAEITYLLNASKSGQEERLYKRNKDFQLAISDRSIKKADIIIGFDTSSWLLCERAHRLNKCFILDQSIAHPNSKIKIFDKLNHLYPALTPELQPKAEKLLKLEKLEHLIANYVVTASSFTKQTLIENGVSANKIVINPYGVDLEQFASPTDRTRKNIRFLFLGSLTSRKGVPLLLKIWEKIKPRNAELWLAGPASDETKSLIPQVSSVVYLGKIPHRELQHTVSQCDVLVFPSFFEGFGLVILEAMASGLPVITTYATAGPDIIEHGKDGLLYDSFDEDALENAITVFLNAPGKAAEMGMAARKKALSFSWQSYGQRWEQLLTEIYSDAC